MTDPTSLIKEPAYERSIFTNRTLNMRSIQAIGYDMDYTLIHYQVKELERMAYDHLKGKLLELGLPVADIHYDPEIMILGLVIDRELGNIVKPNRFGYIKRAYHGTKLFDFEDMRKIYAQTLVDIREDRWVLLTTLFDLSIGCLYVQLVDKLDRRELPEMSGYVDLQILVSKNLDTAYANGLLKDEILKNPKIYVVEDTETPLTLLDQKHADKKLVLITDSEWDYVKAIMAYTFDRHMPNGMTWRDLFDLVIVSAGKPNFFLQKQPAFEVVNEEGLLKPVVGSLRQNGIYLGGHAGMVQEAFGLEGGEIMYVGDHIESDVHASKYMFRWRTALVLRELEEELAALHDFRSNQADLSEMMHKETKLEHRLTQLRLVAQRASCGYGPETGVSNSAIKQQIDILSNEILALEDRIRPLAQQAWKLFNPRWGLLTRAGHDKSYLARLLESYADIYMSRVSNFLFQTPFVYLRSTRSSLPHDGGIVGGVNEAESGAK